MRPYQRMSIGPGMSSNTGSQAGNCIASNANEGRAPVRLPTISAEDSAGAARRRVDGSSRRGDRGDRSGGTMRNLLAVAVVVALVAGAIWWLCSAETLVRPPQPDAPRAAEPR